MVYRCVLDALHGVIFTVHEAVCTPVVLFTNADDSNVCESDLTYTSTKQE